MNYLAALLISTAVFFGGIFIGHQGTSDKTPQTPAPSYGAFQPVQGNQYTLSGAGISNSQTTIQLTSFTLPDPAKTPITMSMFGQIGYGVLEPQSSKIENISFTGVTQNANGTATLTGVLRGLSFYTPYQPISADALSHAGGSTFILSNSAAFYGQQFLFANNVGSSTATITYSNTAPPFYYPGPGAQYTGGTISTTSEFASVAFVNATAIAGAPNATEAVKGISQLATAAQQASSTILGSTAASLILQAKNATDTPQAKCNSLGSANGAGCTIIANLGGHLTQAWIDLTQAFIVAGNWIFNGQLTANATTTIAASNVLNDALVANTVPYQFPSLQGAAGTFLKDNGSGVLSWDVVSNIGTTTATSTLVNTNSASAGFPKASITIPANTLGTSNVVAFRIPFSEQYTQGSCGNGSMNMTVSYGGQTIGNVTFTLSTSNTAYGYVTGQIIAGGATNVQKGNIQIYATSQQVADSGSALDGNFYETIPDASLTVDDTSGQAFLLSTIVTAPSSSCPAKMTYGTGIVSVIH